MYNIPYYKEDDQVIINQFVAKHPFAMISGTGVNQKPVATQVPLLLEDSNGRKVLRGHVMKNTDHHKGFVANEDVLVVFTGKDCYVSGSWYSQPHTASTWNYMSVYVNGIIRFVDDTGLRDIMRKTTLHFEGSNPQSPTVYDNLDPGFIKRASAMIAGFEIEITKMEAVFKLSQDRDQESYRNIIEKLKSQEDDGPSIAAEMEMREKALYRKK